MSVNLFKAIAVTAELTGTDMSEAAAQIFAADLAEYPEGQVLAALVRCRREIKGRLSLSDVINRLDDGRPGAEEAWAMIPRDEQGSVFWTNEMAKAFGAASSMMNDGDLIAARMVFKEVYESQIREARNNKAPVKWIASWGWDVQGRAAAIKIAGDKGRLTHDAVRGLLHNMGVYDEPEITLDQLEYVAEQKQLPASIVEIKQRARQT